MNAWLKHNLENIHSKFDYSMDAVLFHQSKEHRQKKFHTGCHIVIPDSEAHCQEIEVQSQIVKKLNAYVYTTIL